MHRLDLLEIHKKQKQKKKKFTHTGVDKAEY